MRRFLLPSPFCLACLIAIALLAPGCARENSEPVVRRMGERVQVGPLIYNVLEAQRREPAGGMAVTKIVQDRLLAIRISVTNSGATKLSLPLLHLEEPGGESHLELSEGHGVEGWLGLLRQIAPAATLEGVILFDVPTGTYQLRLTDGGDLEHEQTALIKIPLQLDAE